MAKDFGLFSIEPVLKVTDVKATAEYYRDTLGFEIDLLYGDPPTHAVMRRGIVIQFALGEEADVGSSGWMYVRMSRDMDGFYDELKSRGANIVSERETKPWGKREFDVEDCNGYRIRFGIDA